MKTITLSLTLRQRALALTTVTALGAGQVQAQSFDLGAITGGLDGILGMLGQGSIMGMISMIPGLNFLAGLGPIMDIVKMIPGLDGLLGSIPGLSSILSMLGMGGGGNLGPLNAQIQNVGKWLTTAKELYQSVHNIVRPNNYQAFAQGLNGLMDMAGVNKKISASAFKSNPQAASQAVMDALSDQQKEIVAKIARSHSNAETTALRTQAQVLEAAKARAQRTADNASSLQDVQGLAEKAGTHVTDTLNYTTDAAKALKDNKKIEDIAKISGSATLELLRLTANDSAMMTTALANQLKVQVNQAESLGQIVDMMQTERMEKAMAINNTLETERLQYEAKQKSEQRKASQMGAGFGSIFHPNMHALGGN